MKAGKLIAATVMTAVLCSCNEDNKQNEFTLTSSETVITEATDNRETCDTEQMNETELIETIQMYDHFVDLEYKRTSGGEGSYHGDLILTSYRSEDTEREYPITAFLVYHDEDFELVRFFGEDGFLQLQTPEMITLSCMTGSGKSAVRLYDIDDDGMITGYSYNGGFDVPAEMIGFADRLYDDKYRFYDYGAMHYTEYTADRSSKLISWEGTLDVLPDVDTTYLAMRSDIFIDMFSRNMTQCMYREYLTEMGSRGDVTYYRVSPELAGSTDDLRRMSETAFTEGFMQEYFLYDPFTSPGDDTPAVFSEDEQGLVYADMYTGVPTRFDHSTARRIRNSEPGTVTAVMLGENIDFSMLAFLYFDTGYESCPLKEAKYIHAGTYFLEE